MATKYQCEKAIKALIAKDGEGAKNPNIQGYGIGRAKDYNLEGERGYVIIVYTDESPRKIEKIPKLKPKDSVKSKKPTKKKAPAKSKKTSKKQDATERGDMVPMRATGNPFTKPEPTYPDKVETTSRKKSFRFPCNTLKPESSGFNSPRLRLE